MLLLAGALVLGVWPAPAAAHPIIDEGVRHYENADFPRALAAFARAEQSDALTREDVVELLVRRSLVHFGMNAEPAMREDLRRLATLEPNHVLGAEIPPAVRAAFESVRRGLDGRLSIRVEAGRIPDGMRVSAEVTGDPTGLVRTVRVGARSAGGEWTERDANSVDVPVADGSTVEYYAEAVGPGGAVLAAEGSRGAPRTAGAGGLIADGGGGGGGLVDDGGDDGGGVPIWVFIGAGVVAVAAVVVIILLATGGESDQTQLSPPIVE
jgi:hypothetical protein